MKLYRDSQHASMQMAHDPLLLDALNSTIKKFGIDVAVETGTYQGTGSNSIVAESMQRVGQPMLLQTMEVSFASWLKAYGNLRHLLFVDCRWGCSVDRVGALAFIRQDDVLLNHQSYPDIFIDDVVDPVQFYVDEINGMLGSDKTHSQKSDTRERLLSMLGMQTQSIDRNQLWSGESLLSRFFELYRSNRPLVILDSAGGVGYYEFRKTIDNMANAEFLVLLDDTNHLKHFRSVRHINADTKFEMIAANPEYGWALAWHKA